MIFENFAEILVRLKFIQILLTGEGTLLIGGNQGQLIFKTDGKGACHHASDHLNQKFCNGNLYNLVIPHDEFILPHANESP